MLDFAFALIPGELSAAAIGQALLMSLSEEALSSSWRSVAMSHYCWNTPIAVGLEVDVCLFVSDALVVLVVGTAGVQKEIDSTLVTDGTLGTDSIVVTGSRGSDSTQAPK